MVQPQMQHIAFPECFFIADIAGHYALVFVLLTRVVLRLFPIIRHHHSLIAIAFAGIDNQRFILLVELGDQLMKEHG